jgi:ribosomal protein S18 acetylase RimI-like enzyme
LDTADTLLIRPFRPGDGGGLARAWLDAGLHYTGIDPELFQVPDSNGLAAWFEGSMTGPEPENSFLRVAELDEKAVGFVWAVIQQPLSAESAIRQFVRDVGRTRLSVEAIVVQTAYQRRGVGTRLMRAAEAWGRERGAEIAILDTFVRSDLSVPFYEKRMGYTRRTIRFRKWLG